MTRTKPGPGWKDLGNAVWEHSTGVRICVSGYVKFPRGKFYSGNCWPDYIDYGRCVKLAGGNLKRGAMIWALELIKKTGNAGEGK